VQFVQVDELAPNVRPTGRFNDMSAVVDLREARISVGLQDAAEVFEMTLRMLALVLLRASRCDF
jgi:hypothetical protein